MTEEPPAIGLAPDDAWSLLSNVRRRRTLVIVDEADAVVHVTDLAERVAAFELGIDVDDVGRQQWRRVYSALVTCHLLPLSQADAIDYDVDEKTIDEVPATADLAAWVHVMDSACEGADDFPPARCDAREGGPIVTGD
ncbi:hypothetical protein DJ84_18365 [Halorubrum ezzemoulense]|nr:hypothetical protein DJ84_18365 [Halorubrum ezzemoulense]